MKEYHRVWLEHNPHRTEDWLKDKLRDGFTIHHIDGNHDNNSPNNLVLVTWADHTMIHNGKKRMIQTGRRIGPRKPTPARPPSEKALAIGESAYKSRAMGHQWCNCGVWDGMTDRQALAYAQTYAIHNAMIWPLSQSCVYRLPIVQHAEPTREQVELEYGRLAYHRRAKGDTWEQIAKHNDITPEQARQSALDWQSKNQDRTWPPSRRNAKKPTKKRTESGPPRYYWPAGSPQNQNRGK
jgi:hypothetical protein